MKAIRKSGGNRVTAYMQVRNEADRYLETVLRDLSEYVDDIVIVDDASTDGTVKLCRSFPKVKRLVELTESHFGREAELKVLLWKAACEDQPDWLLAVDADELFEDRMKQEIRSLVDQDRYDWAAFRMYDFWGSTTHYREDDLWQLHKRHTTALVRYLPGYYYFYPSMNHHVPRVPLSYNALPGHLSDIRIKHYGWAGNEEERRCKYLRYREHDPKGQWGNELQYQSILDPHPRLVEWKEDCP
ncbi:glycosyltransferase [Paenibacillus prosopidis]|uniref:Glycosyl transferase family 2 n=1 Tax=Paenibacillus prosopidis TaxID=630520 RepID=A0A368W309_9BACL|nr:glycosyltransferase family 2 protein [Paenibacillus prosopidis]RCW49538.1 glycosyl transferase family 2 [Paenibacillus prosopidis]